MKRKWKWLVFASVPVLIVAAWLFVISAGNVPIDVVGSLSKKDVAEIVALVKQKFRRETLPDFSWRSIRNFPAAYRRYSSIKLYTIVPSADAAGVWVVSWYETNAITRRVFDRYWSNEMRASSHLDWEAISDTNWIAIGVTKQPEAWKLRP
jgi:hypothetical protein